MFKIVFLKNERNDATDYYVKLIKKVIEKHGNKVEIVSDVSLISKEDKVLTISLKAFFLIWLRNPKQFIIHWFQGVTPEEALMIYRHSLKKWPKYFYLSFFENLVFKFSKFNFFVSKAMGQHYKKKYKYTKDNYMIMPCYNQSLNIDAFNNEKYKTPTFVYAGSMPDWQCVKESLLVFKNVQKKFSNAEMYLYTADHEKALKFIEEVNLSNVILDYVPYEQLNQKLKNIKYGFLIRHKDVVNAVATPTKMNSYIANGIIPIYTDTIFDFNENINGKFQIRSNDVAKLSDLVIEFERNKVGLKDILSEYSKYFDEYYSDEYYSELIGFYLSEYKVI